MSISSSLRVFDHSAKQLNADDVSEILLAIEKSHHFVNKSLMFTMAVQASIFSGKSRVAAETILRRMTSEHLPVLNLTDFTLLSQSLDAALFESYREAESLDFSSVVDLDKIQLDIEQLRDRSEKYPNRDGSVTLRHFLGITDIVQCILIPLLNTEHQGSVANLISIYLQCVKKVGVWCVSSTALMHILRRSIVAPRTTFDLTSLKKLRQIAREIATQKTDLTRGFGSTESVAARFLAYKFLILSEDTDRQIKILKKFQSEFSAGYADSHADLVIECASWAVETSANKTVIDCSEDAFRSMRVIPTTPRFLLMCMRYGDIDRGEKWVDAMSKRPSTLASRYVETRFLRSIGAFQRSLQFASRPLSVYSKAFVNLEENSDDDPDFIAIAPKLAPIDAAVLYGLVRAAQEAIFMQEVEQFSVNCQTLSESSSQSDAKCRTTLIIAPNHLPFVAQLPIAAIEKARLDGAEVVCMVKGLYPSSANLSAASELLRDTLVAPFFFSAKNPAYHVSVDWQINFLQQKCIYGGINYFSGLHNSLGIIFRRFTLDYDDELVAAQVTRHLIMFQCVHDSFSHFVAAADPSRMYRFMVVGIQYGVGYALRELVSSAGQDNLAVVHASNGYEAFDSHWKQDGETGNAVASYHSIRDLTHRPNTPLAFRPTPEDCLSPLFPDETLYMTNPVTAAYVRKIDKRQQSALAKDKPAATGKRRVLLLGTILPDLSIPDDEGFVHEDIRDWICHSARIADASDDITLVIKQHPSELDHKIGFYVAERFVDLIPPGLRNIEILPYAMPFHDAVASCDVVVLWSGTSSLELSLIGKPYIACSQYAQEEYPLHADQPATLQDYESLILGRRDIRSRPDARLRAIDIIHRTATSPVREVSPWPKRQLLNAQVWPVKIDPKMSAQLMADPATVRLAERLFSSD